MTVALGIGFFIGVALMVGVMLNWKE